MDELTTLNDEPQEEIPVCVVRLTTSLYADKRGLYKKQSITYMKRLSRYHNFLQEDVDNIGAPDVLPRIINLASCADGLYRVVTINEHRDYETGYIDDYDYQLIAYLTEPTKLAIMATIEQAMHLTDDKKVK